MSSIFLVANFHSLHEIVSHSMKCVPRNLIDIVLRLTGNTYLLIFDDNPSFLIFWKHDEPSKKKISSTPFHSGFGPPRLGIIIPFSGIILLMFFQSVLLYQFSEQKLLSSEKLQEPVKVRSVYFRQFSPVFSTSGDRKKGWQNSLKPFQGNRSTVFCKIPEFG